MTTVHSLHKYAARLTGLDLDLVLMLAIRELVGLFQNNLNVSQYNLCKDLYDFEKIKKFEDSEYFSESMNMLISTRFERIVILLISNHGSFSWIWSCHQRRRKVTFNSSCNKAEVFKF